MVFKKLLGAIGVSASSVDTVPNTGSGAPGGILSGQAACAAARPM